jgi:hypothetical protein
MESISTPPHIDYLKDFNHYTTEFGDDFKASLNQFQHDLMLHWREKKKQKIGVSIQTKPMQQDKSSCTRYEAVNQFCQNLLNYKGKNGDEPDFFKKGCDKLDYDLKNEMGRLQVSGIGCRCHKGISNILCKFIDNKDARSWFIFYGQFILVNTPSGKELLKKYGEIIVDIKKDIGRDTLAVHEIVTSEAILYSQFVQENPFTTITEVSKQKEIKKVKNEQQVQIGTLTKDLSEVTIIDFFAFKNYVEINFGSFLDAWHTKDSSKSITKFISTTQDDKSERLLVIESIRNKVQESLDSGNAFDSDAKIRMTEVIEQLDKATSLVDSHYNNNGVVNKAIRELTDWLDKTHRETDLAIRKNISELETKLTYLESAK